MCVLLLFDRYNELSAVSFATGDRSETALPDSSRYCTCGRPARGVMSRILFRDSVSDRGLVKLRSGPRSVISPPVGSSDDWAVHFSRPVTSRFAWPPPGNRGKTLHVVGSQRLLIVPLAEDKTAHGRFQVLSGKIEAPSSAVAPRLNARVRQRIGDAHVTLLSNLPCASRLG